MITEPRFDPKDVPSPCFVIDLQRVEANLRALASVRDATGCRVLIALKAFAAPVIADLVRSYLDGSCASGPHEAQLGAEVFGGETHVYAPAYSEQDIDDLLAFANHMTFNSVAQWNRFKSKVAMSPRNIRCGFRINPECSQTPVPLYDPCAPGSKFGIRAADLEGVDFSGITGLHFHTLCEQNSDALVATLESVRQRFAAWLPALEWFNFGGGHWITDPDYDVPQLQAAIHAWERDFGHQVYLEPGEAVALGAGHLVATVLDIIENEGLIAVLDTSATAHMPDVIEMPYTPDVIGASTDPTEHRHRYRLGGLTCLSGDWIGEYSFPEPVSVGQRIVFADMAHYTMVKTTHFNGIKHPSIATCAGNEGSLELIRTFGYEDYKNRLS